MKPRSQERGQALIMIALAAVGLFGFSALAIDGSRVFSDRRHAQNAADTAALAAALARVRATGSNLDASGNPIQSAIDAETVAAGLDRAATNGYTNDTDSTVEVHMCDETGLNPACEGLGGASPSEFIQVKIVSTIPTTFARVIGRATVTSMVTAIARAKSGIPSPLFNGAALAALKPNGNDTLGGNGNVYLDINNSGTFNNSTDNCGMNLVGNGTYTVDTAFQVVSGQYCDSGHPTMTGPVTPAGQVPYPPSITIPKPNFTCSGNPGAPAYNAGTNTYTFAPGNYGAVNLNSTGNVNFSPGNYCFSGGVSIGGTADVVANSVNFMVTGGEFKVQGSSSFTCNDMLVYLTGTATGMHFNGNGGNFCNSVTFYAESGDVTWNGSVANRFFAPTGGKYKNVLIYMPFGNSAPLNINGNSGNKMTGSIIAVSSDVKISGVSGTTGFHSQIIGYTITLEGASNTTINYVAGEQYKQADPSGIQLTK